MRPHLVVVDGVPEYDLAEWEQTCLEQYVAHQQRVIASAKAHGIRVQTSDTGMRYINRSGAVMIPTSKYESWRLASDFCPDCGTVKRTEQSGYHTDCPSQQRPR